IAANFCEFARVGEMSTQGEIVRLEQVMRMAANSLESKEHEARKLEENAGREQKLSADLEETILSLDRQLNDLEQTESDAPSSTLHASVKNFSRQECVRLDQVMSHSKAGRSWRCDTGALRRLIESEYLKRLQETERRIVGPEFNVFQHLRQSVEH